MIGVSVAMLFVTMILILSEAPMIVSVGIIFAMVMGFIAASEKEVEE